MKIKNKILAITILVGSLFVSGCGSQKESEIPDPSKIFKESDIQVYDNEDLNMRGYEITSYDNLKDGYEKYVDECEKLDDIWTEKIFVGDTSWCYQNKDGSKQLIVNYYENENEINIDVKDLKGEK